MSLTSVGLKSLNLYGHLISSRPLPQHLQEIRPSGEVRLSRTHNYYSQVQGQLEVCDKQYCDFVCWTNKGVHVERILRDRSFFEHIKPSLDHFFQEALLPRILCGSDLTFKENVAPPEDEGEVLYCWCQEPEYGKMIGCDNEFCE